ncbi:MAG: tetratricopeptide repeat protein, partial [Candidatus Brocadiae bacterium]|nr:tetratricopeptide repeat protein [Candidatus Brocadiia bacterium]
REPARSAEAAEGEAAADGDEPSVEQLALPEVQGLPIPLMGGLATRTLAILVGAAALAFVLVLVVGLSLWSAPAAPGADGGPQTAALPEEPGRPMLDLTRMKALGYAELMALAEEYAGEDPAGAAQLYRLAAGHEDADLPRVLHARHKLSRSLVRLGQYDEALRICASLRAVSRPGDELWKGALITSISALGQQDRWTDFFRHLHLLRANSARYADEAPLNRWLAYCKAMAGMRLLLERCEQTRTLYGVEPPSFGRAPCGGRPLLAEDIIPTSGRYGDGTLRTQCSMGELRLLSEGAPLGKVLADVARAADLTIEYDGPTHYAVTASLETISPEHALEMVLGSVGLAARRREGKLTVASMQPLPSSDQQALKEALWGLQEFLILYPESTHVAEAYYALGHLHMTQGQVRMALDQLDTLCKEFPRSLWSVYGSYMAGRARCEIQSWERAERNLLSVVDSTVEHPLAQSAFLWAAHCQVQLGKYEEAVACFRKALADEIEDPLAAGILYNIAFCLEKSGASHLEVEERYTELRTRFPETAYARDADYRLSRMALDRGEHSRAVMRYEFYLSMWSLEEKRSRQACSDLIRCYVLMGDHVRAILLGEVMCAAVGHGPEYREALPLLLEAYEKAGLQDVGLEAIEGCLAVAEEPRWQRALQVEKARLLADLGRRDQARTILQQLQQQAHTREFLHKVRLVEARILMEEGESAQAMALCREAALKCRSEETCAKALEMMGRNYGLRNRFDKAALAYAGKCPLDEEGRAR